MQEPGSRIDRLASRIEIQRPAAADRPCGESKPVELPSERALLDNGDRRHFVALFGIGSERVFRNDRRQRLMTGDWTC